MVNKKTIQYSPPGPVARSFHASNDFVRVLKGPVGSGKTSSCVMELFTRAQEQKPVDGVRRSRWAVIRATYPQLQSTTIRTFMDWFPVEVFGTPKQTSPLTHDLKLNLADGTTMEAEFVYIALDGVDAEAKLKSLEVTGAFINEASEIDKGIFDMLTSRVGRFPAKRDGGAAWSGIIMDTNPPDRDHWLYHLFEELSPDGYSIYHQPSGLSPEAENIENLPDGYYPRLMAGKTDDWINIFVRGQWGISFDGKPVHPQYSDSVHCSTDHIEPAKGVEIVVGIDFGRTPAAAFCQKLPIGRWVVFDEFTSEDMSASIFGPELKRYIDTHYRDFQFRFWGDPAGDAKGQATDDTPFIVLRRHGINAIPTHSNRPLERRAALTNPMMRNCMDGKPAFLLSPKCTMIRKGLAGGFCYKRLKVKGDRYLDQPDKNEFSHVVEALEYALQGGGEGRAATVGESKFQKPVVIVQKFNPLDRASWPKI